MHLPFFVVAAHINEVYSAYDYENFTSVGDTQCPH